jgi:hypothetical protein
MAGYKELKITDFITAEEEKIVVMLIMILGK